MNKKKNNKKPNDKDVIKPFFCNNENMGVRCVTQCLGCDGFERDGK